MKALVAVIDAGLRKLEMALVWVGGFIVLLMMTLITLDVFLRYVFNKPLEGGLELIQFLFIGVVFLGISYVQGVKGHIRIDFATQFLSKGVLKLLEIVGYLMAIFIVSIIVWRTGMEAWNSYVIDDYSMGIIQYPLWPAKSTLTLGVMVLWFRLIVDLCIQVLNLNLSDSYPMTNDTVNFH